MEFEIKDRYGVDDLRALVSLLRKKCPWDMEQTHASIRRNFIEEVYEAAEAIDTDDAELLCEELGDVLLQVLFHADIEADAGRFDIDDAADGECKKMIFRHPHIFGTSELKTSGQVLDMWDEIKKIEKGQKTLYDTLDGVAKSLPSTWRAEKMQEKAVKAGAFDVSGAETAEKIRDAAERIGTDSGAIGDLLFWAVNAARLSGIDPEDALHGACSRFAESLKDVV